MLTSLPFVEFQGSSLFAVPAVHFRVPFAEAVNSFCSEPCSRPDAIAVELAPGAASAAASWLAELGVGSPLPCMLGLVRRNRRIHPRLRETAIRLQEGTGKYLHEIHPSLLHRHLHYSAHSLLCLSPTDSIIEAIRCSLELGVPLFGVDLEEFADVPQVPLMIQDPAMARPAIADYVQRNAPYGDAGRDEVIDGRREFAMAARLKAVLQKHKTVLFTGGLAHWASLQRLLLDPAVYPAYQAGSKDAAHYHRVLVHPLLATRQMDLFPAVTDVYQKWRQPADESHSDTSDVVDYSTILSVSLKRTYERYFAQAAGELNSGGKHEDYQNLSHFESLLSELCTVNQRLVPNLEDVLSTADAMMSKEFCRELADTFMDFDWASPESWPELPVLSPNHQLEGENAFDETAPRVQISIPEQWGASGMHRRTYRPGEPFVVSNLLHGEVRPAAAKNPWRWQHEVGLATSRGEGSLRVWPPCDFLLFGTAFQAGRLAPLTPEALITAFEGSLEAGVHVKATLRASIRGEGRIYVRRHPWAAAIQEPNASTLDPTVFIFSTPRVRDTESWYFYSGSMSGLYWRHIKDRRRFREVIKDKGDQLVQGLGFLRRMPVPLNLSSHVAGFNLLKGIVVFGSPCLNAIQEATWLEETNYTQAPIFRGGDMPGLVAMYRERHRMHLDPGDWISTLVLLAMPYVHPVRRRVVVVAPDEFVLKPVVFQQARVRRLRVAIVPLSYLSSERIQEMTRQYMVYPQDIDGLKYPQELEWLLEQSATAHSNLLPRSLLGQLATDRT